MAVPDRERNEPLGVIRKATALLDQPRLAAAAAMAAHEEGTARIVGTWEEFHQKAAAIMRTAREATHTLMREGLIATPPQDD